MIPVVASDTGFIKKIEAEQIGMAAMQLGAGRATKESEIDLAVGIELHKKIGDFANQGEPIASLHVNGSLQDQVMKRVKEAFELSKDKVLPPKLIYDVHM